MLNGEPVALSDLDRALVEAAGARVLEDFVLTRSLERRLQARGFVLSEEDTSRERQLLLDTFTTSGLAETEEEARRLLAQLRADRNLGEARFEAMLWRSAALRRLVGDQVRLTDDELSGAFELRFGPKYRARLITVATAADASSALRRLRAGQPFGVVAGEVSTDASAARGGTIPPISPADATFPAAVRMTVQTMRPGEISPAIALETGFAIVILDEVIPAPGDAPAGPSEVRAMLARDVRLQQERVLMDQLAREILDNARLTIIDPALNRAWIERRRALGDQ